MLFRSIIQDTAPLLTTHTYTITSVMFKLLFEKFPQLESLFTYTNKEDFTRMAESISIFAINIDKLHLLTPALLVIAKAHVEADIKKEHYVMIGACFIEAIEEVFKDTMTQEFIYAWKEAYRYLSSILIEMENALRVKHLSKF